MGRRKDVRSTTIQASCHVMVEWANASVRVVHSRGIIRIHGSVPSFPATANQRRSADEYVWRVLGWTEFRYRLLPTLSWRVRYDCPFVPGWTKIGGGQ